MKPAIEPGNLHVKVADVPRKLFLEVRDISEIICRPGDRCGWQLESTPLGQSDCLKPLRGCRNDVAAPFPKALLDCEHHLAPNPIAIAGAVDGRLFEPLRTRIVR